MVKFKEAKEMKGKKEFSGAARPSWSRNQTSHDDRGDYRSSSAGSRDGPRRFERDSGFGERKESINSDSRSRRSDEFERQSYKAICSECGKSCELPFRPNNTKPVYCSDCYRKVEYGDKRAATNAAQAGVNPKDIAEIKQELNKINTKLQQIVDSLKP